ncbi:leucine-rich repeat and calponin homology domain-containing protein 4 isoform 2 [Cricetulus griseus]|uniref:Leucine-rich repeat and calponin homology domain-containing protein 4 isoform 2 n=1 Tax=Cricetulus griseus TaxID=10029 RepID=A0A061IAG6_CRIGR|nr:leucine-rich repeat and calponin homology domain-containing protein 4 isoform 2 [Cricetulus griseus]
MSTKDPPHVSSDLSRNRFPEVPEAACQLVSLEGLSLYHNCLRCLNPALGNLTALTYLNLSRNQLSSLPSYICQLPLRVLIVSNNKLGALPPDISTLGSLRQLDVSSNELQFLPVELCSLRSLRDLNVRRNQLSTLPEELGDLPLVRLDFSCNRVSRIPVSFCRLRHLQVILLDSNPLQSPPAQSTDDFSELSFRISELAREPRVPRQQREDGSGDGDLEQVDFIDSHVLGEDEERNAAEEQLPSELSLVAGDVERTGSGRREEPAGEERRHPDTLQLWQERERRQQQQQSGGWGSPRRDSLSLICFFQCPEAGDQSHGCFGLIHTGHLQVLESRLQQPLPEDLTEALASGVILCQLANQLRPRSVPFIHVPSPAVPKLSALKSRKNVESFLEACRKMGVPEADLCSPSDLLRGTTQGLRTTLEAVILAGGKAPLPAQPSSGLGGFLLFYVASMLLLYAVYTRLLGS